MGDHYQFTDAEFVEQFNYCTLDPVLFTHEAHLRLGWIMVRAHGTEAGELLCEAILRYASSLNRAEKFNRTITIASARMIAHFLSRSSTTDFPDFIAEFPRLLHNFQELLDAHYSDRAYATEHAAAAFVEPDLQLF